MKTNKLHKIGWALMVGLICLAAAVAPVLAGKSAEAERFDVDLTLGSDGAVQVSESVVFRYSGGPFTFVKREIPTDYTDGIRFMAAGMDGKPMPMGTGAGQVEVDDSAPLVVTWHFADVSDSSHAFNLTYLAQGVTQKQSAADLLLYSALPVEHDYTIRSSTVRVHYPAGARLLGQPVETNGRARVEMSSGLVTFEAIGLGADETLEVRLEFAPGSLTNNTPVWQVRAAAQSERDQRSLPYFLAGALALALGGGAALWLFRRSVQPEAVAGMDERGPSALPPSNLAPALAGALLNGGGAAQSGLMSTLFDLARRGVVVIEEQPKSGWMGSKDFVVQLVQLDRLQSYEQTVLETLFKTSELSAGMSISLQKSGPQLAQHWSRIASEMKAELLRGGWLDAQRQKTAQTWGWISGISIFLTSLLIIGAVFLIQSVGVWVLLPAIMLEMLALVWVIVAAGLTRLSDRGRVEAAGWKAFQQYLKQVSKGREPATRPDLFETYLPYAAAFGLAHDWADFFQKKGILQIPVWFRAVQNGNSGYEMVAFMSMVDSSSAATGDSGASSGGSAGGGSSSTG